MIKAAHIVNGKVEAVWVVPALDCYGPSVRLVQADETVMPGMNYSTETGFTGGNVDPNNTEIILAEIRGLEAQITPRRLREALLSGDMTFIQAIEDKISTLRKKLQS